MLNTEQDLFTRRKGLDEICVVPEKIISVYSLEKHVWDNSNSTSARAERLPERQTVEEFYIEPVVRVFLHDILRHMATPSHVGQRESELGQGYWIQAEFGSGKSHLLCFLAAIALGSQDIWNLIQDKERQAGRGKRESLYRFWEEGLEAKQEQGQKGIFVIVKTLVGVGSDMVGKRDKARSLAEYILDAAREQLQLELGKNVSFYPVELLADRFLEQDLDRYRADLKKFLRDPRFFEEDEYEDVETFLRDIQDTASLEYKLSCGNKLWRFYTEYLKVQPQIQMDTEDILKHMVTSILAEGYSGVLLILDEVSLFMKSRDDRQRADDETTLVVLSNRLAKVHNLPIWTVCAAQQAIESKMGVKNIIADDRLKLVELLTEDRGYYDIALARVREIVDPEAISHYYLHYKRHFTWPDNIGEQEFLHFFPFHKPALEVLRAITYELTTARSAIHFMHQTLKHLIKSKERELIRLWELFDETVEYEEEPSGAYAGVVAIKTSREQEYRAYEACRRQIDGLIKGVLKVHRDKAVKTIQTLFLYHIARIRQQGITPEELANAILIERDSEATPDENIQHYAHLAEHLRKELRQVVQSFDEESMPRYRFDPVVTGIDPQHEFRKARDEADASERLFQKAWEHLLALDAWPIPLHKVTIDLSHGNKSLFREVAPFVGPRQDHTKAKAKEYFYELTWQGRQVSGLVKMEDVGRKEGVVFPPIASDVTDRDFAVFIGAKPAPGDVIERLVMQQGDPRILFWTPGELNKEERDRVLDFAAYRQLVSAWQGKETDDAVAIITWVANTLQMDMGRIARVVPDSYARGRVDALNNFQMEFHVAGEQLSTTLTPLVERVLSTTYESRDILFDPPFLFRKEEGVKVINGIVKTGHIPKGVKPNQDVSAAQNFGFQLKIMKKRAEKNLDTSGNPYIRDLWTFINEKLADEGQAMSTETIYKNFMGIGGPKDYGLSRRMIQIYLFCLVKEGRISVEIGPKAGLAIPQIDYTTIEGIDFSAKILDALTRVRKMAKPEHWDILRPYVEVLLRETIPETDDDVVISTYRKKLHELFATQKETAPRFLKTARNLFEALEMSNPYEKEQQQITALFALDITSGDDITSLLYGLKESLGYQAFDIGKVSQADLDDLGNRLKNYWDLQHFLAYEAELRTASVYSLYVFPEHPYLERVRSQQQDLAKKLMNMCPYIDAEIQLKTELIGRNPPDVGESGTLGALLHEYIPAYEALHDSVMTEVERYRKAMQSLYRGKDLKALKRLETIPALQPSIADEIKRQIEVLINGIFACSSPSRTSIVEQLQQGPSHSCGLSFQNYIQVLQQAKEAAESAQKLLDDALNRKLEVFLNTAVRERLNQGRAEPLIADLLSCTTIAEVRDYLLEHCMSTPALLELITRYLKKISIKKVRLADFIPTERTVEREQIVELALEFQAFLEEELDRIEGNDVLPILQIE